MVLTDRGVKNDDLVHLPVERCAVLVEETGADAEIAVGRAEVEVCCCGQLSLAVYVRLHRVASPHKGEMLPRTHAQRARWRNCKPSRAAPDLHRPIRCYTRRASLTDCSTELTINSVIAAKSVGV